MDQSENCGHEMSFPLFPAKVLYKVPGINGSIFECSMLLIISCCSVLHNSMQCSSGTPSAADYQVCHTPPV